VLLVKTPSKRLGCGRVAGAQEARVVRGFGLEGADSEGDCGVGCAGAGARQGHEQLREVRGEGRPGAGYGGGDVGRVGGCLLILITIIIS